MNFSEWVVSLEAAVRSVLEGVYAYLPRVVGAVVVLFIGWVFAKAVRYIVERLLRRAEKVLPARLLGDEREAWGTFVVRVVGVLTFWLVILLAAGSAAEILGLDALTGGFSGLATHFPRLIAAVLVLLGGAVAGNFAAGWIRSSARTARIAYGDSAASAARVGIVLVASVVALSQAGIDSTLLVIAVATLLAAFLGAVALAFGLGAKATVANIVGAHYVQRAYRVNQRIRIGEHEGRILEIQPTGVLLEASDGVTLIPASAFNEKSSVLLDEEVS